VAYRDIEKRRKWFRDRYRKRHDWELKRARAYRAAHRGELVERTRTWLARKIEADPPWRLRIRLQTNWKKRCREAGVYHAEGLIQLLGMEWGEFRRYLQRRFKHGMSWDNLGEWTVDQASVHVVPPAVDSATRRRAT